MQIIRTNDAERKKFLEAKLVEEYGVRRVELTYVDADKNQTDLTICNGLRVSVEGKYADGTKTNHGTYGYLAGLHKLGPELREQIPQDWHQVLGRWLTPKE